MEFMILVVEDLHGIPGIIGGLGGFISASVADNNLYGDNISSIFPARAEGRTAVEQGLFQLALYVLHWEFQFVDYLQR